MGGTTTSGTTTGGTTTSGTTTGGTTTSGTTTGGTTTGGTTTGAAGADTFLAVLLAGMMFSLGDVDVDVDVGAAAFRFFPAADFFLATSLLGLRGDRADRSLHGSTMMPLRFVFFATLNLFRISSKVYHSSVPSS